MTKLEKFQEVIDTYLWFREQSGKPEVWYQKSPYWEIEESSGWLPCGIDEYSHAFNIQWELNKIPGVTASVEKEYGGGGFGVEFTIEG